MLVPTGRKCRLRLLIRSNSRIPVSVVLDNLAAGLLEDEIIQSYPALTSDAIRAATAYAAELARERIVELPGRNAA